MRSRARRSATRGSITSIFPRRRRALPRVRPAGSRSSSRRTLRVPPEQSITDVLYDHGIEVATSCEAGVCGACRTTVLDGAPDHRDAFLSAADKARNDCMMPCVSRCRGERLVLDL
ncbi:2Fe-2S iron-sulfur cluster-binding protein [Burkholderia ubonensis]|uniref:2Fe-2S iron-sulfur cluster-binding protein n=1 Tax=Burkholderia ubonensis TaxID=101571 RepID=UPI0020C921D7|nr:2Fe-2S iron-sulfur cluster binding domain-containing protein [Burkholderia ubonensis]